MLPPTDWRWAIVPGDKIRYPMDGSTTLKSGVVLEIEFCDDDVSVWIRFANGDDGDFYLTELQRPLED